MMNLVDASLKREQRLMSLAIMQNVMLVVVNILNKVSQFYLSLAIWPAAREPAWNPTRLLNGLKKTY